MRFVEVDAAEPGMAYKVPAIHQVQLLSSWSTPHPRMHERGHGSKWNYTRCGVRVFDAETFLVLSNVTLLRADQAILFAIPCKKCWP